jgi:hypothetical protein
MIEYLLYVQEQLASNMNTLALKYSYNICFVFFFNSFLIIILRWFLTAKRRELAELKEESKGLKSQIRTRKQNIATLESMLLASKSSSQKPKRSKHISEASDNDGPPRSVTERPAIIRFYVTGTTSGLCVECNERGSASIADVIHSIQQTFATAFVASYNSQYLAQKPRSNLRGKANSLPTNDDVSVKLMYQGRQLLEDSTIDDNSVRVGDSLVCVCSLRRTFDPPIEVEEEVADVKVKMRKL